MQDQFAAGWKDLFEHNALCTFDDFWQFQGDWVEQPNQRRGGWSGVQRCELRRPAGGSVAVFLKRQENHVTRDLLHPFIGFPTLRREFHNLRLFAEHEIPTPALLYFAERRVEGRQRAVLITEALTGFRSLEHIIAGWFTTGWPPPAIRSGMILRLAEAVRRMHDQGIQHNCLYAKHIFFKPADRPCEPPEVRIIDLEKARRRWPRWLATRRDLITLQRHCPGLSLVDRVRFFKVYMQAPRLRQVIRPWHALARRLAVRNRESPPEPSPVRPTTAQKRTDASNTAP